MAGRCALATRRCTAPSFMPRSRRRRGQRHLPPSLAPRVSASTNPGGSDTALALSQGLSAPDTPCSAQLLSTRSEKRILSC